MFITGWAWQKEINFYILLIISAMGPKKIGKGNMATHGMIDLETLGVNPDSVLMTIGAVKFNPLAQAEPYKSRCQI